MKIILVRPDISDISTGYKLNDGRMEPLPLGILAGLTPDDIEVVLRDERVEELSFDEPADLVAISVDTFVARRSYDIADQFRFRGVPVILGGIHATLAPEEAQSHADAVVVGDAEPVWTEILADVAAGMLRRRYQSDFDIPQKDVFPQREHFHGKGYLPVSLVQFTRGCPFRCSFCAIAKFFGSTHRCRPVESVVREIEQNDLRMILFTDDNLTANRERAKELFRALKPLRVHWASQVSVDVAADPELLELMAESGCMGQLIGFDSISLDSLLWMNKGANVREFDRYARVIERLREFGFQTWASFMFGNDYDTPETVMDTVRFAV
ncbi:MAG: B12-binding domain-containing radical SAM protein, partial [Bacteroidetes bacterium]|nr:B12-binding domain-containing radical SAM protein [Bacteroidota bacterium]